MPIDLWASACASGLLLLSVLRLLRARLALGEQFGRLRLLVGREEGKELASQVGLLDGGFGLRLGQFLGRRTDQRFVDRNGLDRLALRGPRRVQALPGSSRLRPVLLR